MPTSHLHSSLRLVIIACAVALLCLSLAIRSTYGALTGRITNTNDKTGSGTLLYTHTYAGATTCSSVPVSGPIPVTSAFTCHGGIQPATATPTSGSSSGSDSIQYRGTAPAARVTQTVSAASCGPVQLANAANSANPMVARYGTAFAPSSGPMTGSGSIAVDGASPGGYESAVLSQVQPNPSVSLGNTYGLGVWFKTSSTAGGALVGIGSSATNVAGSNDRVLYITASGKVAFIQNSSGATTTTTASYNDGAWHFAYVTMSQVNVAFVGLTSTTTLSVDGAPVTGGGLLVGYSAAAGYWHLGWSPVSGLPSYFAGSLSNFVVFNTAGAPNPPTSSQLASQSTFDGWAASSTERWRLNDTGTSTFAGPYPYTVSSSTNPCSLVNLSWSFATPASCGWSPNSVTAACSDPPAASLVAFTSAGAQTIASPAPGTTQTSTIKLSRGAGYDTTFLPGLRLYAPLTFKAASGGWANTFTWADATSAFLA
ncbi:MAG: hypothetical protein ABR571_12350 [Jatrophihabitans sp.]|uniref:hypothetical protein n=1 Tax=Jatrophihabitans sp. TaxID=1932789 RepID=UPI00390DBD9D